MKGVILYKEDTYYTYLKSIFEAINNRQKEYNWLISDCVCYPANINYERLMNRDYTWISGEDLTNMINDENFQIIWGVFSGFKKNIKFNDVMEYSLPYANGYSGFWKDEVSIQHPLSDIEMVAWDSSLTLFISKDESLVNKVMSNFAKAEDLGEYNKQFL